MENEPFTFPTMSAQMRYNYIIDDYTLTYVPSQDLAVRFDFENWVRRISVPRHKLIKDVFGMNEKRLKQYRRESIGE
jgi:hypothetical protein